MPDRDVIWSFTREERIAYFSMEMALAPEIPTCSGGLGMLAGDAVRGGMPSMRTWSGQWRSDPT